MDVRRLTADESAVVGLVDRAAADRDPTAFGELYDLFVDHVYRYLYFRTGQHTEAEDLTEQVFVHAWQAIQHDRRPCRPFLAWLYHLAHNVHVDHVGKQPPTAPLTDDDRPLEVRSDVGVTQVAQPLDADLIARALAKLSAEQQQVIALKFVEGVANDQIACITDEHEGAIRALQMRGLLRLRRILVTQGEGHGLSAQA